MSVRFLLAAVWLKPVLAGDKVRTARAWGDGRDAFVVARPGSRRFLDRAAAAGPSVLSPAGRALLLALAATSLLAIGPAAAQSSNPVNIPADGVDPAQTPVVLPPVEVTGPGAPARDVDSANRALQAAARQAQNRARAIPEASMPGVDSPGPAVGVSGQAGASLRLGPALGTSVHRPAPPRAPSAPRSAPQRAPSAPRPGGPS